jgi:hypothetical protein
VGAEVAAVAAEVVIRLAVGVEVVIQVAVVGAVVGAGVAIQVAAVAAPAFKPGVQRPTLGVVHKSAAARARSGALLPLRILPGLPREADFTRAPGRRRTSQALRPAEEFMLAAARQFSLE